MTPEWFLEAASGIGRRICTDALWHDGRCNWTGDHHHPRDPTRIIHGSLPADLYGGTSGIGWFLAHLWQATDIPHVRRTARGALRHALAHTDAHTDSGLYTGATGVALATVAAAQLLDDTGLLHRGRDLARGVIAAARAASSGHDVIAGDAGIVTGLVALAGLLDDDRLLQTATSLAHRLIDTAQAAPVGRAWPSPDGDPPLCGLAHGASGVAMSLLDLASVVADPQLHQTATDALAYERAWFDREHGGWPDLRSVRPTDQTTLTFPTHWCHGSAGIGLVRLQALAQLGEPMLLAESGAAIDHATATTMRALSSRLPTTEGPGDLSLCHGAGSVVELHLVAADVTGDVEHLRHARQLAWDTLHADEDSDPRELTARLPCGVHAGGETPDLMLGLAGIATVLLRLSDPAAAPSPLLPAAWRSSMPPAHSRRAEDTAQ